MHHSCHTMRTLGVREGRSACCEWSTAWSTGLLPRAEDCCGFGGTFAVKMAAISAEMVDRKAGHVQETGAGVLVGLDMSCLMNIGGRLRRRGARVAVKHLAQVLAEGWRAQDRGGEAGP